jgi:glycosyltransferase involved in cell wall biosynthesis/SAM-dependent methyltransferase
LVRSLQVLSAQPAPEPGAHGRIPRPQRLRPLEEWLALAACLPRARQVAGVLRASGCSLVHCNNSFPYQAPTLLAAGWAGLPVAAHVRNPLTGSRLQRWLARRLAVVLPLHAGQEAQLRSWNLTNDVVRCPDGIELPPVQAVRVAALRHRLLPQGGVLLGSLGRLTPQKGYDELIAAAARLLPRHPEVRLVIFGEGAERPALQALIALHRLEERVLLAGYAPDTANLLAALDLFVCSSRWEGLPLVVLEAMLAGVPVVATRSALAGDPRLFSLLAAPPAEARDEALAQALEHALAHRASTAERSAAARRWVEAEFAPAAAARQIDAALAQRAGRDRRAQSFYEAAYRRPEWQRSAAEASGPGARFTKMWYRAVRQNVLPRLQLQGRRVLEIGCGYGWLAPYLTAGGADYVGLDLAESALRQFPRGLPVCMPVRADACRLPFAQGSFDVIFCLEVLEHIPERRALLSEICRVARPGAVVVLTTPSYCNLFLPLKLLADCGWSWCRRYLTRQPVDHTQFAFRLRALLSEYADVVEQRAIRLHPPLFERLEYRFGPGRGPARINDWLFQFEQRWATRFPWRHFGLHTCFLLRPHGVTVQAAARHRDAQDLHAGAEVARNTW